MDDSFVQIFIEEALEHLADMEEVLLAIERDGAHINEDRVNKVFRSAHTIKGSAGLMGFTRIQTLAHKIEDVLGLIRKGHLTPNPENINQILLSFDTLKKMALDPGASEDHDISAHVEGLDAVLEGAGRSDVETTSKGPSCDEFVVKAPDSDAFLTATGDAVSAVFDDRKGLYLIRVAIETETEEYRIVENFKRYGAVLSITSLPGESGEPVLYLLFASVLTLEDLSRLANEHSGQVWRIGTDGTVQPAMDGGPLSSIEVSSSPPAIHSPDRDSPPPGTSSPRKDRRDSPPPARMTSSIPKGEPSEETKTDSKVAPPSSIRVSLSLLDRLMNMAGELVLSRNQLLQGIAENDAAATEAAGKGVDSITSELQETVMLTRMQPIGTLFNRFQRLIRDLGRELGKEVALDMEGKSVELDRTLLENLSDPLTHLLRNAVDHGIEPVDERKKMGKGETGRILLRAFHEAGQITIEIRDDGKGLDPERIASKGVTMGFVTQEQAALMTPREKVNLIFYPGFTTADSVSNVSGRGVGMDVVKNNIHRLGGQIDLDSCPGMGMRIRIKLPLTMAIIPGQIISVEGQTFILPQANLVELLRVPSEQIRKRLEWVGDAQVIRLRDQLLPLVRLADVLGIERTYRNASSPGRKPDRRQNIADRRSKRIQLFGSKAEETSEALPFEKRTARQSRSDRRYRADSALNIAVLSTGPIKYGVIVDRFHDTEEIVVKPLGRHLKVAQAYAGATIMGNGEVALILDSGNIARIAQLHSLDGANRAGALDAAVSRSKGHAEVALDLLTFRNAETERFAMPLSQVLRIEKIETSAIQTYGQRKSIQYRGGNLPVFSVDEIASVSPPGDTDHLLVIVSAAAGKRVGLLATGPVDSVTVSSRVDDSSLKQPGIMGSVIIDNRTALIVDLNDMIDHLYPGWISKDVAGSPSATAKGTLLVVEDSTFFRQQIKAFLENKGFNVLEAEDGMAGWESLKAHQGEIDLVITDIEMPRMNGLELSGNIRAEPSFSHIPIIALTTLADEEDEERGKDSGIDDYQIKLDKEQLYKSIETLLQRRAATPEG